MFSWRSSCRLVTGEKVNRGVENDGDALDEGRGGEKKLEMGRA